MLRSLFKLFPIGSLIANVKSTIILLVAAGSIFGYIVWESIKVEQGKREAMNEVRKKQADDLLDDVRSNSAIRFNHNRDPNWLCNKERTNC